MSKPAGMVKILNRIRLLLWYSYSLRQAAVLFICSPLVARNPLYLWAYRKRMARRMQELAMGPPEVRIESTAHCNYRCIFCPREEAIRPLGTMDDSLCQQVLEQAAGMGVRRVVFAGFGEPLLDPMLVERIRYAKAVGLREVWVYTNGFLLTAPVSRALIEAGLDWLSVSVDAASPETYLQIHGGAGSFARVKDNLQHLCKLRQEMNSPKPRVDVTFHPFRMNQQETGRFRAELGPLADGVVIIPSLNNWAGAIALSGLASGVKFPCLSLWTTLQVCWDGRVSLCCMDYDCIQPLGDVKTASLQEIWAGRELERIRELHGACQFGKIQLCKNCDANYHYKQPWWF